MDPAAAATEAQSRAAALVAPDERACDLRRALRRTRTSGVECVDGRLAGGCLGPTELVVLHGESGSGKSALLRSVLAAFIAGAEAHEGAGHGAPAVLVDAEGCFDVGLLAEVLRARAARLGGAVPAAAVEGSVEEALSRLLVFRPREPVDLLRDLEMLRELLAANPRVGLLVVDAMSAWLPLAGGFPRAVAPFLEESWRALARLQSERCVAVIVAYRGMASGLSASSGPWSAVPSASRCRHLGVRRLLRRGQFLGGDGADGVAGAPSLQDFNGDLFEVAALVPGQGIAADVGFFRLSEGGEVLSLEG